MFYRFVWWVCRLFFMIIGGMTLKGRDNLPKEGAFIVAGNHCSNFDPFLIALGTTRPMANIGKDSLFRIPVLRRMLKWIYVSPVDRSGNPKAAMDKSVDLLRQGHPITIFPEGRRNKSSEVLLEFKKGASLLAIEAGVPVIPAGVKNTRKFFGRKTVVFGPALQPPSENNKHNREAFTVLLREKILDLYLS